MVSRMNVFFLPLAKRKISFKSVEKKSKSEENCGTVLANSDKSWKLWKLRDTIVDGNNESLRKRRTEKEQFGWIQNEKC